MEERNKALRRKIWQRATKHLISTTLLACVGVYLCNVHGNVRQGDISQRLLAAIGVLLFILGATLFLKVLTDATSKVMRHYLNAGRTAAMKFFLNLIGFGAIILSTLTLLEIPIDKLLLGGAAIGVILSVAAQQSLANFFASVVIIISRPFQVGDELSITAGALGGTYKGKIKDIGLTHTKLTVDGKLVMLPNATLLSAGVIIKEHASSSK